MLISETPGIRSLVNEIISFLSLYAPKTSLAKFAQSAPFTSMGSKLFFVQKLCSDSNTCNAAFSKTAIPSGLIAPAIWSGCRCVKNKSVISFSSSPVSFIASWRKPQVGPNNSRHPASIKRFRLALWIK